MARRSLRLGVLVAGPFLLSAVTACDPPVPPPDFTVTSTDPGGDADPGDGVCEATPDGGDCTVQAAIDEGNALGSAAIALPPLDGYPAIGGHITGRITLEAVTSADPTDHAALAGAHVVIDEGASLVSRSVDFGSGGMIISGAFVGDRFTLLPDGTTALRILPTGVAILRNSFIGGEAAVDNQGRLHVYSSTVQGWGASGALATSGAGTTNLTATAVMVPDGAAGDPPACTGTAPVSHGYNLATDGTCALQATGDIENPLGGTDPFPAWYSPRVDAIPVGSAGCGTDLLTDIRAFPRPTDGNGDGTVACDIGAWER